jgi:hypothetical protein
MMNDEEKQTQTKETETRQQAGVRLANQRMPKLRKCLTGIGNLGGYGLDKKQIQQLEKAIDHWVSEAKARLNNRKDDGNDEFQLR